MTTAGATGADSMCTPALTCREATMETHVVDELVDEVWLCGPGEDDVAVGRERGDVRCFPSRAPTFVHVSRQAHRAAR
jgi:hypothetical protein